MEQLLEHMAARELWLGPHGGDCRTPTQQEHIAGPGLTAAWPGLGRESQRPRAVQVTVQVICSLLGTDVVVVVQPISRAFLPHFKFRAGQLRQVTSRLGLSDSPFPMSRQPRAELCVAVQIHSLWL